MKTLLWTASAFAALSYGQSTISAASTGAATLASNPKLDANWTIVTNSVIGETGTGPAAIVQSPLPIGPPPWVAPDAKTSWIAPQSDQSNATRPGTCCSGEATYRTQFNVTGRVTGCPTTDPSPPTLQMKIAVDDYVTLYLNGTDDSHIIYSSDTPTYNKPFTLELKQCTTYVDAEGYSHTPQFVPGVNTITAEVTNFGGGPTGLYISFLPPASTSPNAYRTSGPAAGATNALPDPVDSGSGQFYDTYVDFRLGGPAQLGFSRFYSSQLSTSGVVSALGANWMSTYDAAALVNGAKAQVLLFGGRVVTFNNSAGAWQLVSPLSSGYQFAAVAGGFQFLDPDSQTIYSFSSSGALTKIENRHGDAITVTPGSSGPTKVADGLGRTLTFNYSGTQLASVQDQSGRLTSFTYASGLLASSTDPLKAVTNYTYTTIGAETALMTKETLPLGNAPTTQTYDASARVLTQTGTANNTAKIGYDGLGGTTIADAKGNATKHLNDDIGDLMQLTDPLGGVATILYDNSHRRTSATDRTGGTRLYAYDTQSGFPSATTDASGNSTTYSFSPSARGPLTFWDLTTVTYADGNSASLTYDPNGNLLTNTTPDGAIRTFAYDAQGRLSQSTDPLGNSATYSWNADGSVASIQDALGNSTAFEYDSLKRIVKTTDPDGLARQRQYDGDGRQTTFQPPRQAPWQLHYNVNGQIDTLTNPLGGQSTYAYSSSNKRATDTDPLKNVTSYTFDTLNQLTKVQNGAGEAIVYTLDALGRAISTADNSGPLSQYGYDAEGRLTSETDATGRTSGYTYTAAGQVSTATTASGNTTQFGYDFRGNLTTLTNPLGDQYTQIFDAMGRLLSITGPGGFSTFFQLDADGMPLSFTSAHGRRWTFTYDPLERIASMTDPLGNAVNYIYQGTRVSEIDFPLGSVNYSYDALGRVSNSSFSDGTAINTTYNAMGQITSSDGVSIDRDLTGQPTKVNGISITRDGNGKPLRMTYASGKVITYTYDKAGRVDSVSDWTGGKTAFTYDAASRRAAQTLPNGVTTSYGVDPEGRLNSITYGGIGSIALTHDANGKIISADRNLPIVPVLPDDAEKFNYDAAGQLTGATYDSMGRVTAQGVRTYNWNLASQLTSFADPVNSGSMTYDGLGEIGSSTAPGAAQNYVFNYAMDFPALAIVREGGSDQRYYVYLPNGELLYSINASDGSRQFYHFDEMGNTAFLTDNSGAVTDSYAITPYGEISDHIGTSDNPFTWQGQYGAIQEGDGLYFLRSRHYDASTARFLSRDPFMDADPQSSEPYAYARGNPMLYTDPFGSCWPWDVGCIKDALVATVQSAGQGLSNAYQTVVSHIFHNTQAPAVKSIASTPANSVPGSSGVVLQPPSGLPIAPAVTLNAGVVALQNVISHDGGSLEALNQLISQDGGGLLNLEKLIGVISHDGGSLTLLAALISQDGGGLSGLNSLVSTLIAQDGSSLVGQDGSSLVGQDGSSLVGQDGSSVLSTNAAAFRPNFNAYKKSSGPKPKNNKN